MDTRIDDTDAQTPSDRDREGRFLPSHVKRGGRKVNTPNYGARFLGQKLGVNPLEIGLEVLKSGYVRLPGEPDSKKRLVPVGDYLQLLREMAKYFAPQLSAVATQISAQVETSQVIDMTQLMSNPALASAAQTLAIAMSQQPRQIEAGDTDDRRRG
jgi:hypothetical protein